MNPNTIPIARRRIRTETTKSAASAAQPEFVGPRPAGAGNEPREVFGSLAEFEGITRDFRKFLAEHNRSTQSIEVGSTEWDRVHKDFATRLFGFQLRVQSAAYRVELASKVVEHATSGTRTVLQTQA